MRDGRKNGQSRLDRLEGLMELLIDDHLKFADEHKLLLTAQVVLTDRVDKLAASMEELRDAQKRTDEQMKATDDRMGILIRMMDELIRNRPPESRA